MHLIDNQYLIYHSTNTKDTIMHDLYSIYTKVHKTLKRALKQYLVDGQNLRFYSNRPKMTDLEILSLSLTAECLGIDSENLLWSKLRKDYSKRFPKLIHRTRFNARRKALAEWLVVCADIWSAEMSGEETEFIVDSIPIPVCKISRERNSRVCRTAGESLKASKGWSASDNQYFIGYKLHLITSVSGVYQEHALLPANVHDIAFLKQLEQTHLFNCQLIGDRAYRSHPLQLRMFDERQIDLQVPYRRNQRDFKEYPYDLKIKRKQIETTFSQYCDEFMLKRNYAKSYAGLSTRIDTKITAMTFKQYWNFLHGNKISRTKHSLAA